MSATFVPQTKDSAIARILTRPGGANASLTGGKHAGMAIVVGRRHVMSALMSSITRRGDRLLMNLNLGSLRSNFSPFAIPRLSSRKMTAWHPMKRRAVDDIAVLALDSDVPPDVGVAIFTDTVDQAGRPHSERLWHGFR